MWENKNEEKAPESPQPGSRIGDPVGGLPESAVFSCPSATTVGWLRRDIEEESYPLNLGHVRITGPM